MPIDVRLPISGLFLAVGVLLVAYGAAIEGVLTWAGHLNVIWGTVMVLFGLALGYYGLRAERKTVRS
jgi:phosphotransferase system  glucose/maltose/N-acetylglucosamine-specific IIC component